MNRGLPVLDQARGRDFLVLTKRSAASGDENAFYVDAPDKYCARMLSICVDLKKLEINVQAPGG